MFKTKLFQRFLLHILYILVVSPVSSVLFKILPVDFRTFEIPEVSKESTMKPGLKRLQASVVEKKITKNF